MGLEPRINFLDWLKWLAIFTMFVDHLKYLGGPYSYEFYLVGRAAYPIFAILCGMNFAIFTSNPFRFFYRVLILGLFLIPFQLLIPLPLVPLNPILTLALGLGICLLIRPMFQGLEESSEILEKSSKTSMGRRVKLIFNLAFLGVILSFLLMPIFTFLSYGSSGVILVVLSALYGYLKPYGMGPKWLTSTLFILIIVVALGLNNHNFETRLLGAFWAGVVILFFSLRNRIVPVCPLPNNYWLYLSFPISMLAPVSIKYFLSIF